MEETNCKHQYTLYSQVKKRHDLDRIEIFPESLYADHDTGRVQVETTRDFKQAFCEDHETFVTLVISSRPQNSRCAWMCAKHQPI